VSVVGGVTSAASFSVDDPVSSSLFEGTTGTGASVEITVLTGLRRWCHVSSEMSST